jgi:hypothetical protein
MQLTETEQRLLEEAEQRLLEELRNAPPVEGQGEGYPAPLLETFDACKRLVATPTAAPEPGLVAVLDRLIVALAAVPEDAGWADYRPTADILPSLHRFRELVAGGVPSPELGTLAREIAAFFGLRLSLPATPPP